MAESHVEAPQASRVAQHVRAGRASRREATDITAAFDQILASAAQPAQQAPPQVPPSAPSSTLDANLVESQKPEFPQKDENTPVDVRPADGRPAPDPAPSPVHPEPSARANHAVAFPPAKTVSESQPSSAAAVASHRPVRSANSAPARSSAHIPAATRKDIAGATKSSSTSRERLTGAKEGRPAAPQISGARQALQTAEQAPVASKLKTEPAQTTIKAGPHGTEAKPGAIDATRRVVAAKDAVAASQARATSVAEQRPAAVKLTVVKTDAKPAAALEPPAPKPDIQVTVAAASPLRRAKEKGDVKSKAVEAESGGRRAVTPTTEIAAPARPSAPAPPINASPVEPDKVMAQARETDPKLSTTAPAVASAVVPAVEPRHAAPAETRRPREARTAPSANVEARTADPVSVTSAQTPVAAPQSNAAPTPVAASAAPAAPVIVNAAVTLAPAAENKPAAPATPGAARMEPHAAVGVATPGRENGKTLLDNAKAASTQARQRTDQQQEVDRVRLVERVAKALRTAQDRGAPLKLRLTPPELGVLRIELSVRNGALSARLEAETPAAKAAILENLPALRERLTAQEIKIERFDVDLMQQPNDAPGERHSFADADSSRERAAPRTVRNERQPATPKNSEETQPTPIHSSTGRLNVLA